MTIRELRKDVNLSAKDAATLLGISRSMLYMMERGKRKPSIRLLKKIAQIYECTYGEIIEAFVFSMYSVGNEGNAPIDENEEVLGCSFQ